MNNPKQVRPVIQFFRLTIHFGKDEYGVVPQKRTADLAGRVFQLRKHTGDRNVYLVREGRVFPQCNCRGFRRWGTPCKHIRMLRAAQMLD